MAEAAMGGGDVKGDTFLTDMLMTGNKPGGKGMATKKGKATFASASKPKLRSGSAANRSYPAAQDGGGLNEDQSEFSDYEDEYRDVVFDVEHSRALVAVADNYLEGREEPLLALPAPGDDSDSFSMDETKSLGGASRFSGASGMSKLSDRNFVNINKSAQSKIRPFLRQQRPTDRLAPDQRARLEEMIKEIEDNIDEIT